MNNTIVAAPQALTDTDKAGIITVVTTFCLLCIWILFVVRVYIRLKVNGPWKWDDSSVAIATVLSTVRSAVVYLEVNRGYGRSGELLDDSARAQIGKALYGDTILYILAMLFSKSAVILLCQRMTPKRSHTIAIWAIFGASVVWAVMSILLVSVNCSPGHPWADINAQCVNIATRWKAICALDIITEAAIFGASIYLVFGLHMSLELKAIVVLAFGIRLPTVAFSAARLVALLKELASDNPTLAGSFTAAWTSLELGYAIAACTFSSLGAFLRPFDQGTGPSRSGSNPGYAMRPMDSGNRTVRRQTQQPVSRSSGDDPILRNDATPNIAVVVASSGSVSDNVSVESNDSKKGIIIRQMQYDVTYGARSTGSELEDVQKKS